MILLCMFAIFLFVLGERERERECDSITVRTLDQVAFLPGNYGAQAARAARAPESGCVSNVVRGGKISKCRSGWTLRTYSNNLHKHFVYIMYIYIHVLVAPSNLSY